MADHFVVALALVFGNCELAPDIEPFAGVFVDFLFSNFHTDIANEGIADVVDPVVYWASGIRLRQWRQIDFDEEGGEKIGVAGNECGDAPPEIAVAVEIDGNGFDGEGCVATVDVLEERELGVAG